MPAYIGPDRYCRVCNTLLSHLESGVCLVHECTDRRAPDDAVMLAEEELREAQIASISRDHFPSPHGTPIAEAFRDGSEALRAHYARLTKKKDTE